MEDSAHSEWSWKLVSEPAVVRFSFGKFKETSAGGKQHHYTTDVTAENLWKKKISSAEFALYVLTRPKFGSETRGLASVA
jgi:hypothetical protein